MAPKTNKKTASQSTFFQPQVGVAWITHRPLRIIAVVGQRVAELVRKLKGILCPVRIASRKSDPDAATRRSFEIGLRMISAIVNVHPLELSVRAMLPNF